VRRTRRDGSVIRRCGGIQPGLRVFRRQLEFVALWRGIVSIRPVHFGRRMPMSSQMHDVIVVGAGAAGLETARRLLARGLRVIVLEARDRLGGRVLSTTLATGTRIDLGAQYISTRQRRVMQLAGEAGVVSRASALPGQALHLTAGGVRRLESGKAPVSAWAGLDVTCALWRLDRATRRLDRRGIVDLDRMDGSALIRSLVCLGESRRTLEHRVEADLCQPLSRVSAYELLHQLRTMGGLEGLALADERLIVSGASRLIEHLAAGMEPCLHLRSRVVAITQDQEAVSVETTNGQQRARRVVLAVPPVILRGIRFRPELPQDRAQALEGFTPGRVIKTVVEFPEPWWRELGLSGEVSDPGGRFCAVVDGSTASSNRGVLVAFTTARAAEEDASTSPQKRVSELVHWLAKISGVTVPEPLDARSMDWFAEPFSLGGYACRRGLGAWSRSDDLFAPFGLIHFAGTETAAEWRSYLEGALQSAERAADEILASRDIIARS